MDGRSNTTEIQAGRHFSMKRSDDNRFSGAITIFHEGALPEKATPAGYAALIDARFLVSAEVIGDVKKDSPA